jgi:hypothetical protein
MLVPFCDVLLALNASGRSGGDGDGVEAVSEYIVWRHSCWQIRWRGFTTIVIIVIPVIKLRLN